MSDSYRVGLYDACPAIRTGLRHILSTDSRLTTIIEVESTDEILGNLVDMEIDLLILDIDPSNSDELDVLKQFRLIRPEVKLVIFTACRDFKRIMEIFKIGINGFKLKTAQPEDILRCLHTVLSGGADVDAQISNSLMEYIANKQGDDISVLSTREQEVLELMADGRSNNDIADRLCITPRTVKYHVSSIFNKLNVKNRTEAAAKWVH